MFRREVVCLVTGHSATSVVITAYFISLRGNQFTLIYVFILWSLLFMFSRLYFVAHYPSEKLSGAIAGFLVAKLFVSIIKKRLR